MGGRGAGLLVKRERSWAGSMGRAGRSTRLERAVHAGERKGGHLEAADGAARAHSVRLPRAEEGGGGGTSESRGRVEGEHENIRARERAVQAHAADHQCDEHTPDHHEGYFYKCKPRSIPVRAHVTKANCGG